MNLIRFIGITIIASFTFVPSNSGAAAVRSGTTSTLSNPETSQSQSYNLEWSKSATDKQFLPTGPTWYSVGDSVVLVIPKDHPAIKDFSQIPVFPSNAPSSNACDLPVASGTHGP